MSEGMTEAQAAEALAAAVSAPDTAQQSADVQAAQAGQPLAAAPNQAVEPPATEGVPGEQGTQVEPEFTPSKDIDLSGLSDEQRAFLDAREKEMQRAFTQKTQELAEQRQQAEQAIQFLDELNSNPYFAQQVVGELSQRLQVAGFTPAQADLMAQQQVQQQQQAGQPSPQLAEDEYGDPYLQEIDRLRQEQQQITGFITNIAEQNRIASLEANLNRQAAYIQSQNPDWTDGDLAKVVNIAYAYNGDLVRAAEDYKSIKESAIQEWVGKKSAVTAPAAVPAGGSALSPPEKFDGLDDPRLEAAALRRLNESLAG